MRRRRRCRKNSDSIALSVYEQISPFIVTDCSANLISSMLQKYGEYTLERICTLPGENKLGEEYYEFYADTEALETLVLELFYGPKKIQKPLKSQLIPNGWISGIQK